MSLDPDLITAQWGLVSAFGIAVTLLAPKADQYYQDYVRTDNVHDGDRARQWGRLVRNTPIAVLGAVLLLSILAAPAPPSSWTGVREEYSLLVVPIIAQIGFVYLIAKLVPGLPRRVAANLQQPVPDSLPHSSSSPGDTVITIANKSDQPLTLWWIDHDGRPINTKNMRMITLPERMEYKTKSRMWHYWLIRTQYGMDVGIIQAMDKPTVTDVDQEAVNKVSVTPQSRELLPVPDSLPASPPANPPSKDDVVAIVANKSDQPLTLWWLDRAGVPSTTPGVRLIPAGGQHQLWTRPGHYWLVKTRDGADVGIVHAAMDIPTITEVSQDAVDRVSLQPQSS